MKLKQHVAKIPVVAMDYFFVTKQKILTSGEARLEYPNREAIEEAQAEGELVKCLMVKCTKSKAVCAFVVPTKGVDAEKYATKKVTNFIEWLGHTRILLKSDNEPSMNALLRDVLKELRITVEAAGEEHSAPYDSQSNGAVEVAIKNWRDCSDH